jgi:PLP dependent protein
MSSTLEARVADVRDRVARAAERAGRNGGDVKLVAVSKTHPAERISAAAALGLNVFGENKVQEAEVKISRLGSGFAEWHLIGRLQSNKARKAVRLFDVIQTVDSVELARRLDRICGEEGRDELRVFIEVDLAGEAAKAGVSESGLVAVVDEVLVGRHLKLIGLMALPPYFEDAEKVRPYFARLRQVGERLAGQDIFSGGRCELSMGMSHDFEVAIEEGATLVRIGTSIFGERG